MRTDIPKNNPNDITEESIAAFFVELNARLDAEAVANAPSEAAQALAASWAQDTRTEDERLAQFYGTLATHDMQADHSGLSYLRSTSERSSHDSAVINATLAAHYGRLHLAASSEQRLADFNSRHAAFGLSIAADIRATGLRMLNSSDRLERFDTAARIVDQVRQ